MRLDEARRSANEAWDDLVRSENPLVLVGTGTCGLSAGAAETVAAFREEMGKRGIPGALLEVGCMGLCHAEPLVEIRRPARPGIMYGHVSPERAAELVERYLINDDPAPERALGTTGEGGLPDIPALKETPTLKPQVRRILARCGLIDPTSVDHYLATAGYTGLERALTLDPEAVIDEMKRSGLRGRGGAGFPTWQKWKFCHDAPGNEKYIICNADEGDPGAFMNRALLEGDPHSVLEGMIIAARAIGAQTGYIYCRAEYPLALDRIRNAIQQMRQLGMLGQGVLDSGMPFEIIVKEGAGAFVCGEETALMASIEGKRGMPRPRPPFPAVSGLWGKPTVINNVESYASTALIFQNGADWFARYGSEKSKGTKTFSLVGKVKRSGLVEVPLGITLREMIFAVGGGVLEDQQFKAVQTGGPSGGCIPSSLLDTPVDYDSLTAAGSIMGSGGMVVMDDRTCMVDIARYFVDFTTSESCGKCVPCRLGTKQMLDILNDITEGRGRPGDVELLEELGQGIRLGSLCGLGQTAPNPVLSTIRYFRDEYEAHINEKRCPAMVCRALIEYRIDAEKCVGCGLCKKACPVEAISGEHKGPHVIDQSICIKCGSCLTACPKRIDAVELSSPVTGGME